MRVVHVTWQKRGGENSASRISAKNSTLGGFQGTHPGQVGTHPGQEGTQGPVGAGAGASLPALPGMDSWGFSLLRTLLW